MGYCEYTDIVHTWDRVTLGTNFKGVNEIDHLEDDETHISTDYDHISDLIQAGTTHMMTSSSHFLGISCFLGSGVHQKYVKWVLVGCEI